MTVVRAFVAIVCLLLVSASPAIAPGSDANSGVIHGGPEDNYYLDSNAPRAAGRGVADRFRFDPGSAGYRFQIFEDSRSASPDNRLIMPAGMKPADVIGRALPGGDLELKIGKQVILVRHQFTVSPGHRFGIQHFDFATRSISASELAQKIHAALAPPSGGLLRSAGIAQGWGDHDIFRVNRADSGLDIFEASLSPMPHNELVLGPGLAPKDAEIWTYQTEDYVLSFPSGPRITLERMRRSANGVTYGVQAIRFADGTVWTPDTIIARLNRVALTGAFAELTDDTTGRVLDTHGHQLLHNIKAFGGGDTIIYRRGYGQLTIDEEDVTDQPGNILAFGAGIAPNDVIVSTSPGDYHPGFVLSIDHGDDSVALERALANRPGHSFGVQRVRFANGTEWTYADLLAESSDDGFKAHANDAPGMNGDGGSNILRVAPIGADYNGHGGGDTFLYDLRDGRGQVNEEDSTPSPHNKLVMGKGILPAGTRVLRDEEGGLYLDLDKHHGVFIPGMQRQVPTVDYGGQSVEFADGTRWSKADLLRKAAAEPLDHGQVDQKRAADDRRNAQRRADQIRQFDAARTEAIYSHFMGDLNAGLHRIGLPAAYADEIRRHGQADMSPAAVCLNSSNTENIQAWNRGLKDLSAQLDLKYGTSDVDTAPDYMGLQDHLTRLNQIGGIMSAIAQGLQLQSCTASRTP